MLSPKQRVDAAVRKLKEGGHTVQMQIRGERGTQWFEVDGRMLVSWEEMQGLGLGSYSLVELEEEFKQRARQQP